MSTLTNFNEHSFLQNNSNFVKQLGKNLTCLAMKNVILIPMHPEMLRFLPVFKFMQFLL